VAEKLTLAVEISLASPLLITSKQVGFVWESETFIPGSVLRGAIASVAGREADTQQKRDQFLEKIFDRPDAPGFSHAYLGLKRPVGVLPLTARTCKRFPGFQRDARDDEQHGTFDTLLQQAFEPSREEPLCRRCMAHASGSGKTIPAETWPYVVSSAGNKDWRYVSPRPLFRRIGRTAVSRERGAVAERMLYTFETIATQMSLGELDRDGLPLNARTSFHAFVDINNDDPWRENWAQWLQTIQYLGRSRSRGLGHVEISVQSLTDPWPTERERMQATIALAEGKPRHVGKPDYQLSMLERIQAFTHAVYQYRSSAESPHYWYFTIDLQSDTIWGDVTGPRVRLTPEDLALPADVELQWWMAHHEQVGGWSAAWGLPKPLLPALSAGSVFLYRVPTGDESLTRQVLDHCIELEREGIGQRSKEGYGEVQICAPFHLKTEVK
jgi:CRISPR-associated protein Csx10